MSHVKMGLAFFTVARRCCCFGSLRSCLSYSRWLVHIHRIFASLVFVTLLHLLLLLEFQQLKFCGWNCIWFISIGGLLAAKFICWHICAICCIIILFCCFNAPNFDFVTSCPAKCARLKLSICLSNFSPLCISNIHDKIHLTCCYHGDPSQF